MKQKIMLTIAVSLDGCIADEEGGFNWICGHNDTAQDTEKQFIFYHL